MPRVETLPFDELPGGVPAPARPAAARDAAGRFQASAGTRELARAGGKAAHESRQLAQLLGLWTAPEGHQFAPYAALAREFRDTQMARLALLVGGGQVGPGPASIISTAAIQLAGSRWLYDRAAQSGDAKTMAEASKMADSARQNLSAAHELCAKEALAAKGLTKGQRKSSLFIEGGE